MPPYSHVKAKGKNGDEIGFESRSNLLATHQQKGGGGRSPDECILVKGGVSGSNPLTIHSNALIKKAPAVFRPSQV